MLRLALHAMGTRFELVLAGGDERRLRAAGEAALEEIADCDRRLSRFRSDSLLAHLNRMAAARRRPPVRLDADTFELFEDALAVHAASGGAFDVTIAPLMCARGVPGSTGPADPPMSSAHDPLACVGSQALELDRERRTLRFLRSDVELDLGAIGKGHALDLAARALRAGGVRSALLHGGTSSVVALGAPPDGDAWRIRVERGAAPVALLVDGALSVSAAHGRALADGGGHVLDPRTGVSVPYDRAVAVASPSARLADAWSTALLVAPDAAEHAPGLSTPITAALGRGPAGARRWTVRGTEPERFEMRAAPLQDARP